MNHIQTVEEPDRVMLLGDVHGNGHAVELSIDYAATNHIDAIVQVGDFGFWTPGHAVGHYLTRVATRAREREVQFYWLDGNHEDHSRRETFADADTEWVHYLPRGTRWQWWGLNFMAVGGAFSIDRFMRKEGVSVWVEELVTDEDVEYANREPHNIDVMLTHDCPTGVDIPGIGTEGKPRGGEGLWPEDMMRGAEEHRRQLAKIWETHHPRFWAHGHYHVPYHSMYNGTYVVGLGMDGMKMSDSTVIITKDSFGEG